VIGNLQVAINALNVMRDFPGCDIALVVSHPSLRGIGEFVRKWCEGRGVEHCSEEHVNSSEMIERIGNIRPDYIFSIYNPTILKAPMLAIPRKATINFHAGPLPTYRGMHTFSWAIINGEREYGVAWHLVDEGIDTGNVLFQRMFPMAKNETALSLSQRSFDIGVGLLAERLGALLDDTLVPDGTPRGISTYYSRGSVPNGGEIDFGWPFERIDRFVRGLNYYPAPNPFVLATTRFSGFEIHPLKVVRIDRLGDPGQPGRIYAVEENQIVVQAADGLIGISELLDERRRKRGPGKIAEELGLRTGSVLG
jgi:methionyl-tRNA formyltransferase